MTLTKNAKLENVRTRRTARLSAASLLVVGCLSAATPASAAVTSITLDTSSSPAPGNLAAMAGHFQSSEFFGGMSDVTDLDPTDNSDWWRNYAMVTFTASANQTGAVFGQTSSAADTVLLFYEGAFNTAQASLGLLAFNDDTDEADHQLIVGSGVAVACEGNSDFCPQITVDLTEGQFYSLVLSVYEGWGSIESANENEPLGSLQTLYTNASGSFSGRGGNVSEPTTLGLLGVGLLGGALARRRRELSKA